MRKVIGIGETVFDVIFKDDKPIGAYPGGSTFNALISLGRCGVATSFISEVGDDRVGARIVEFLGENGVDASKVCRFPKSKSHVSLAFLDDDNDAEYIFYKDHDHDQIDFSYPDIQPDDIVLFGSYYAVNPVIRSQVAGFLEHARNHGAIIYYDVNYRPSHAHEVMKVTPNLIENLEYADLVRGSRDDFQVIYGKGDSQKVYQSEISFYCKNFIYTDGSKPVEVRGAAGFSKSYAVDQLETVSTIGAGDNFNAGFIFGLLAHGIRREDITSGLSVRQWDEVMAFARAFSSDCCKSLYNYVSAEFAEKMRSEIEHHQIM